MVVNYDGPRRTGFHTDTYSQFGGGFHGSNQERHISLNVTVAGLYVGQSAICSLESGQIGAKVELNAQLIGQVLLQRLHHVRIRKV